MTNEEVKASIILPCYNEEESLETVYNDIQTTMKKHDYEYEIIIIDDCSTDRTAEIAKSLDVRYFRNEKNMGAGASRKVGIAKSKYEIIVYLDADCTYSAEDIPRLLRHFPESDHVNGYRDREMGYFRPLRKFVKALSRYLASFLVWEYIADLNTGLKAFKKAKIVPYLHLTPPGFSCVTTMTLIAYCTGQKVSYITTHYKLRVGDSKFHPVIDTFRLFLTIFRTVGYLNPLRLILFIATVTSVPLVFRYITNPFMAFITASSISGLFILISMYTAKDNMRFE